MGLWPGGETWAPHPMRPAGCLRATWSRLEPEEALTIGRVVAELNAYAQGRALGLYHPRTASAMRERKR